MHRYCQCIAVRWGGQLALIQDIEGGSLLLLLVLAVKKREVLIGSFLLENPKGTYVGSGIKNVYNGKKEMTPTLGFGLGRIYFKKETFCNVFSI
jgi:hypothetical protein